MASQRNPHKKNVSGYLDESLKGRIKETGLDEAGFVEYAIVRALLTRDGLTKADLQKMVKEGKLRPTTILSLKYEKLI